MDDLKPSVSVQELENDIEQMFNLRMEKEQKEAEAKAINEQLTEIQNKVMGKLESLELTSYKAKAGTFSFSMREGFRVPKDLENKKKFLDYLKDKGIFDEMITVNSQTLNSWAKAEIEAALERNEFDYQVPGLEKAQPVPSFKMTQSRGGK
jgi:ATP-dependent Lon protease